MGIKSILERNPIIPAIKDNITLEKALNSNPSQSTFTVHSYFRCTDSYSSVRGWVHHYKLTGFYVY